MMTKWQEIKIYIHYCIIQSSLKHDCIIINKDINPNWKNGRGAPDKEEGNLAFYYLWKNIKKMSFEKFLEKDNWGYRHIDNWYNKFKNEIE